MVVPVRYELQAQVADDGIRLRGSVTRQLQELSLRLEGLARGLPDPRRALEERSQRLDEWEERLRNSLGAGLRSRRQNLAASAASLRKPDHMLRMCAERLAVESRQLVRALGATMKDRERALSQTSALLESYSYERVLERGFALVADAEGKPVTSAKALQPGDQVALRFAEGAARAAIMGTREGKLRKSASRGTARPKSKASDTRQGKLL
jgi:exodeoxyribonuclease VII large subunit